MKEDVKQEKAMSGAQMIDNERTRQITAEGWDAAHDDGHADGALAWAGVCYAELAASQACDAEAELYCYSMDWPWALKFWKPSPDPVRNLVKAGALIAAEIDRLQRSAAKEISNA